MFFAVLSVFCVHFLTIFLGPLGCQANNFWSGQTLILRQEDSQHES